LLAELPVVRAIGEIGLDDGPGSPPLNEQIDTFEAQLAIARARRLAVVLHVVGLHDLALEILRRETPGKVVVHYFQGSWDLARRYLERGCYVAVGKPATRSENGALREAVRRLPADRLILETDTYPLPGRTTEPRDIAAICVALAKLRGELPEALAAMTTASYRRLFEQPADSLG
jgi:TatD DNase family protein